MLLLLSVLLQFEKIFALLNILNPRPRRAGTSSYIIKSGLCPGCLRPLGHGQLYMIPFWIRLHMRMVCKLFFSMWVQFDNFFVLLKILNPGLSWEGTSSLYYI